MITVVTKCDEKVESLFTCALCLALRIIVVLVAELRQKEQIVENCLRQVVALLRIPCECLQFL